MNRQKEILEKEFRVNEHFSIKRAYFEDMPCPLFAWKWSDERMEELAANVAKNLAPFDENDLEGVEDDFWATIENEAVKMGMQYYEDLGGDRIEALNAEWASLR